MTTRSTGLTSKREGNCNAMVTWSRLCVNGHVIPISSHPSLPTEPLRAPRRCHPHLSRTDSDITSHTSTLALSGGEVLRVLRSRGQAACLMAGSREKTTYRSAPSWIRWWWSEGVPHALWKATGGATSEVVRRRLAGRGQAWLSGRQHQLLPGLPCVVKARLPVWSRPVFPVWWRRQKI